MPAQSFRNPKRIWRALLNLGFSVLCIRFLVAAGHDADWTLDLLGVTGFGLAWWRPFASLFALILGFSLLNGLETSTLLAPYSPLLVVASSMWLGVSLRRVLAVPAAPEENPSADRPGGWISPLVEVLATVALLFLFVQIWEHRVVTGFWEQFWHRAIHGPGDPSYFLTSAFLWLHGLFYFRAVREHPGSGLLTPEGIKLVFFVNAVVLVVFFGLQSILDFPVRWVAGFQSPYEDIATFGIMAASILIFCLTLWRRTPWPRALLLGLAAILLAIAVGASWSRGSYLACAVFLGLLALLRLPRYLAVLVPVALVGAVIGLNLNAGRISLVNRPYLERLMALVRFEKPETKSSGRFELYQKAWAMIQERPWTGHGSGSFYGNETAYSRPGDPNATMHQLPHNILLQLAAEQGLPVAGLFICLVGATLWGGARCWFARGRLKTAASTDGPEDANALRLLALGLTLALGAYLQANLTWDILLVHPTQPFFFWFLMAALWATIDRANAGPGIRAKS
jgi:O-antigen ligase